MTLETVPNDLIDGEHQKLDELLHEFFRCGTIGHLQDDEPPPLDQLLCLVVLYLPKLEQKYGDRDEARTLLAANPELESLLREAWSAGNFKSIRNLKILRPAQIDPPQPDPVVTEAAKKAWNVPYRGDSAIVLQKIIRASFSPQSSDSATNQIPVIQSSGMGKSRCVDEVAKSLFTIPFNLRPATDTMVFLTPTVHPGIIWELFTMVSEEISSVQSMEQGHLDPIVRYANLAAWWRNKLGGAESPFRTALYQRISDTARAERDSTVQHIAQGDSPDPFIVPMREAAEKLRQAIESKTSYSRHDIVVVLYFDEAHYLTKGNSNPGFSAYDALCNMLNAMKKSGVYAVYLSKVSVIAPPAPPSTGLSLPSSFRGGSPPQYLEAPFIECPFDVYDRPMIREGERSLEYVCLPEFLVRFGRPLFWTLYESGNAQVKNAIADFVKQQLTGRVSPSGDVLEDADIGFAVFSSRLLLPLDALGTTPAFEAKQVANHLRVAYSISHPEDVRSFSSSEPIVAEAAAQLMNESRTIVKLLDAVLQSGLIPKGERRDAVARLLLILAHDRAAAKSPASSADGRLFTRYTHPVRLVDFLQELFADEYHDLILNSRPVNLGGDNSNLTLKSEFEHAYINFTHFMKADDSSVVCTAAGWRGLARANAWLCHDRQPFLNIIIPVFFKMEGDKVGRKSTSVAVVRSGY
ncbi:hypothetical protein BD410DRAFT_898919 [Rickenella mellea]|uniref:Uncharacterized protein n=1 Tax=Rickenella mellea TaxID=50990 RepID=A0A4Y7Q2E3_9AGAM|nr:hypothetical protein BD410DRAFT_898919 [Rickenella mellea]